MLTNMVAPYRVPLFNEISRQCPGFHVIFLHRRDRSRLWDVPESDIRFSYEVLEDQRSPIRLPGTPLSLNLQILVAIRRARPKVLIIGGWRYLENWLALVYGKIRGIPLVMFGGLTESSPTYTGKVTEKVRSLFVRSMNAATCYSSTTAGIFRRYGVSPDRVVAGCNVGNIGYYHEQVHRFRIEAGFQEEAANWPRPLFLFVGQLVTRKGLFPLLEAFSRIGSEWKWGLAIAGSGAEEAALKAFCKERDLRDVRFVGFQQREKLARFYALSDILVLPSLKEVGAIVLSEALASGLFLMASRFDGVAPDLVDGGERGILIDPSNVDVFASQIKEVLIRYRNSPWDRDQIAEKFMATRPLERYASAILDGVRIACI